MFPQHGENISPRIGDKTPYFFNYRIDSLASDQAFLLTDEQILGDKESFDPYTINIRLHLARPQAQDLPPRSYSQEPLLRNHDE